MLMEVTGNTYPAKDQLKALGARYVGAQRVWHIDAAHAGAVAALGLGLQPTTAARNAEASARLQAELAALPTRTMYRVQLVGSASTLGGETLFATRAQAEARAAECHAFGLAVEIVDEIHRDRGGRR